MAKITMFILISILIGACSSAIKSENLGTRMNVVKPDGDRVVVADFNRKFDPKKPAPGWHHYTFSGTQPMIMTLQPKRKVASLRCEVNNAGSLFLRHVEVPLKDFPVLTWKWLVERNVVSSEDERSSSGDDSAARLFVSFQVPDESPRQMEIIWARQLKKGQVKKTHGFNHVVLRGVGDATDKWYDEKVDLEQIYRQFWPDGATPTVDLIGFMSDTDDTGGTAVAYFADVKLNPRK